MKLKLHELRPYKGEIKKIIAQHLLCRVLQKHQKGLCITDCIYISLKTICFKTNSLAFKNVVPIMLLINSQIIHTTSLKKTFIHLVFL